MDRRVLGSGAIVCSAMVLWAHPATKGASVEDCEKDSPTPACATSSQAVPTSTLASVIRNAPGLLPFRLRWSGSQSDRLPETMETAYGNLLKQAQAAVQSDRSVVDQNRLASAVAAIAGIPKNSRHYELAQKLQEDWSQELLQQAIDRCQQGDMAAALSIINAIAPTSPQHGRAAELQAVWRGQAKVLAQATSAQNRGDWQGAIEAIESLQGTPLYNSLPVQALLQQSISSQFQPDADLMHLASASPIQPAAAASRVSTSPNAPRPQPPKLAAVSSPMTANEVMSVAADPASMPVSPLPDAPRLEIGLAQAMEWAQPLPSPAVASTPRATPHRIYRQLAVASSPNPVPPVPPPAVPPPVPPEPVAALPTPTVHKAIQPGELASPRSDDLLTTQPVPIPAIE